MRFTGTDHHEVQFAGGLLIGEIAAAAGGQSPQVEPRRALADLARSGHGEVHMPFLSTLLRVMTDTSRPARKQT